MQSPFLDAQVFLKYDLLKEEGMKIPFLECNLTAIPKAALRT